MEKRILQIIIAIIGIVPILTGLEGILPPGVSDKFYGISISNSIQGNIILDSNFRYFSGLWFGLGIVLFWIIPSIEKQKIALRIISCMIFIGGIGRVISMITFGIPPVIFIIFTLLELLFPLLLILQNKISKQ
jgi:hypothetical protein